MMLREITEDEAKERETNALPGVTNVGSWDDDDDVQGYLFFLLASTYKGYGGNCSIVNHSQRQRLMPADSL